ncbi:hypothetical protein N7488_000165 [Penicillium malachiteum]|nr:hypothetical protein N7488_000165 [Penicillium malachiteum]
MTMAQIKAYGNRISPIELAADAQDANLFELLVNDLEARNGTLGDVKFNCIWETAKFELPVSDNSWRAMTKGERIKTTLMGKDCDLIQYNGDQICCCPQSAMANYHLFRCLPNLRFCLHIAAHRKDDRFVKCLLENGADPNQKDYRGRTALHIAILNGFAETMTALAHGGSKVNQRLPDQSKFDDRPRRRVIRRLNASQKIEDKGTLPIFLASGDLQIVHGLLLHGADPNLTDENGASPLHNASSSGNLRLLYLLLKFGAHGNAVGADGLPALQSTTCRERTCSALQRDHPEKTNDCPAVEASMKSNENDALDIRRLRPSIGPFSMTFSTAR